jgi:hypothetical protein
MDDPINRSPIIREFRPGHCGVCGEALGPMAIVRGDMRGPQGGDICECPVCFTVLIYEDDLSTHRAGWLLTLRARWQLWRELRRRNSERRKAMVQKRPWRAVSPFGSLDLGVLSELDAIDRVTEMGHTIAYVDWRQAIIFFGLENPNSQASQ